MADFDDDGCDICTSDMQDSEVEDNHNSPYNK